MKYAYVYVLDTLADWELGYVTAELNSGRYFKRPGDRIPVKVVGSTKEPITTQGGMKIVPETVASDITPDTTAVLLLPGADTWKDEAHQPIIQKAKELLEAGANVAAICGATAPLADAGVFDDRPHTSNAPEYLELTSPNYKGQEYYKPERAVADSNLITASSAGSLLWAKYILERLGVFSDETLTAWYDYFDTGDAKHFILLMESLPKDKKG